MLDWYGAALDTVHGREAVRAALADEPPPQRSVHLLALEKAADAMLQGVAAVWETAIVRALVVAPGGAAAEVPRLPFPVRRQADNHPVPGLESLTAGSAVADFLQAVPAEDALLVLLSGGASSLAEWPHPEVDLAQLRELNERLLAAGLDIRVMNALRGRFSRLKAGGAADTAAFWAGLEQVVPGRETGTNVMDLLIVRLGPVAFGAGPVPGEIVGQAVPPGAGTSVDPMARQPERAPTADPKPSAAASSARPSPGVHAMALRALQLHDPARKCECVERLLEAWRVGGLEIVPGDPPPIRIEIPGRPVRPQLVRPQDLPRRGLHTLRGRQALLHAVTHIEFNAINLALDAVYRFRDLPAEYVSDWLQVAAEEARHFRLLTQRLTETGVSYGDFPAHNGLWEMAVKTDSDPMERMALVPRVLEARGLDVTPGMIQRLQAAGDAESVAVLRVIQREEVSHVAIGSQWFRHLAAQRGLEPEQTFLDLLALHMPGRVRPPFAMDARLAAGFSRREMKALEDQAAGG